MYCDGVGSTGAWVSREHRVGSRRACETAETHHGHDVEVAVAEVAPEQRAANGAAPEDEDFERVRVLCGEAKGCREGVVELVNLLVERAPVEGAVGPVVERVLKEEKADDLGQH